MGSYNINVKIIKRKICYLKISIKIKKFNKIKKLNHLKLIKIYKMNLRHGITIQLIQILILFNIINLNLKKTVNIL